jgi:pilus assembly protein HofN
MNTEINFIEKKQNIYSSFLWWGIVFIILLLVVVGMLLYQKNQFTTEMTTLNHQKEQIEASIVELQKEYTGKRELKQLQEDIQVLQSETIPTVPLYHDLLNIINSKNLLNYDFAGEDTAVEIQVEFTSLDDAATNISSLSKLDYVSETELTNISQQETAYEATLTLSLDQAALLKEFSTDD